MLGGRWAELREEWEKMHADARPPVFIIVCKNTALAKVIYEWLANGKAPAGIPDAKIEGFRNRPGETNTIRVDSKVVQETDTGEAKDDEQRWMRFTLDTVGKADWPADSQGRPLYPDGFEELARKLQRPLHPPGRDVRCVVSVGMLTEGWDCQTVTQIIGLRPFMSQLLCEQVVGRGLRRTNYEDLVDDKFPEEVAEVLGVPFEVVPFKATPGAKPKKPEERRLVHAVPEKARYEITFPRVEGYTQAIRDHITVDWESVPSILIDPSEIPPEVQAKALSINNKGRLSLSGPGRASEWDLSQWRAGHRLQELAFDLARDLTRQYLGQGGCEIPGHRLFRLLVAITHRYLGRKVQVRKPGEIRDLFLSPYYGWLFERLRQAIRPDTSRGETPEVPQYEASRGPGSTCDVSFTTSREVREGEHCHLNWVVCDTGRWEQWAAYFIDTHPAVEAFVKNSGLGFAVPYFHNGQMHDYIPDFIIRLKAAQPLHLILEIKGYDPLEDIKRAAAERWVQAVNADGRHGQWRYAVAKQQADVRDIITRVERGAFCAPLRTAPA